MALPAPGGIALGLLDGLAGLSRHRLLDRLIRGRAWIGLVAFALIGIVAMQLWVVKLGVGIGRALEHEGLLRRENSALSIEDSKLSSGERVEQLATARGMMIAPPGALRFDTIRGALDTRLAAAALGRTNQALAAGEAGATSDTFTQAASGTVTASPESSASTTTTSSTTPTESTQGAATASTGAGTTTGAGTPTSATGASESATTSTSTSESATTSTGTSSEATSSTPVGSDGGTQPPAPGG